MFSVRNRLLQLIFFSSAVCRVSRPRDRHAVIASSECASAVPLQNICPAATSGSQAKLCELWLAELSHT